MDARRRNQFRHLAAVKAGLATWSSSNGIPLAHVDFVVPFIATDFSLDVWLFYATDLDIAQLERDGTTERLQDEFLSILRGSGYPAGWLPEVAFYVDSAENVERNYEGSYFYRLR